MSQVEIKYVPRLDIVRLLLEYEKFPCLWKRRDPNFNNRKMRDSAERSLLQIFDYFDTNTELRQKIRNIRGTYNQERNKVKKSFVGGRYLYKPKLVWYDLADSFLKQNEEENDNESNLASEEEDCHLTETGKEAKISFLEQLWSDPSTVAVSNSQQRPTSKSQPTASPTPTHTNYINKKIKIEMDRPLSGGISSTHSLLSPQDQRIIDKLDESLDNSVNVLREVASRSLSTNEFTIFGEHVASQLQTLPLIEALQLQADILSLITTVRVRCLQNISSLKRKHPSTNCSNSEDSSHE